jgi:hypothetical protein
MNETYTQCRLHRGATQQVAWIPSAFAVRGKYIRIKDVDGWRVVSVGAEQSAEYVREHERDFRHQRAASDI